MVAGNIQELTKTSLLKPIDVADRLQISRSLAYQLMQTGELPCVKIHSSVRVRECDLVAFIEQHMTGIYVS